jgi:hypothetical protein
VKIGDLDQRELVIQNLEKWLGMQIDRSLLATWEAPFEKARL